MDSLVAIVIVTAMIDAIVIESERGVVLGHHIVGHARPAVKER